ncbi:MAG: sigma-70 family RNA polymerase sigma factor [Eubacterium sp.]|nr:sigma-70 family RNA polymerase sigma factor [Eubacterium sp.]
MDERAFEDCMRRMAAGDRDALRCVYETYLKLIFSVCMNQLKNKESAEDVTSEYFIRLFNSAGTFKPNGHHKAWMITIARNMCIDYMRKNGREIPVLDEGPGDDEDGPGREISAESERAENPMFHSTGGPSLADSVVNRLTLEAAMKLLTAVEKEIIDMKLTGGLTFREIAEMLNMPQGTVSWHYNEAIKKLRRYCSGD